MIIRSLSSWSRQPGFSAAELQWLGSEQGTLDRPLRIVVIAGAARHRVTGEVLTVGMIAEFDLGEAIDLDVTEDMTYWTYGLQAAPSRTSVAYS